MLKPLTPQASAQFVYKRRKRNVNAEGLAVSPVRGILKSAEVCWNYIAFPLCGLADLLLQPVDDVGVVLQSKVNQFVKLLRGGDSCTVELGVKCHCLPQLALRLDAML